MTALRQRYAGRVPPAARALPGSTGIAVRAAAAVPARTARRLKGKAGMVGPRWVGSAGLCWAGAGPLTGAGGGAAAPTRPAWGSPRPLRLWGRHDRPQLGH